MDEVAVAVRTADVEAFMFEAAAEVEADEGEAVVNLAPAETDSAGRVDPGRESPPLLETDARGRPAVVTEESFSSTSTGDKSTCRSCTARERVVAGYTTDSCASFGSCFFPTFETDVSSGTADAAASFDKGAVIDLLRAAEVEVSSLAGS